MIAIKQQGIGGLIKIESFEAIRQLQKLGYFAYGYKTKSSKPFVVLKRGKK